jgi:hypothetical protein
MKATRRTKVLLWTGTIVLLGAGLGTALWIHQFRHYTPAEAVQDVQAALAARNAPKPLERFLELRYGTLTDPANRQKAFLDFFNVGHIKGLNYLVTRMPPARQQANIKATAEWIANYRQNMTPEEKQSLRSYLQTDAAHATLQQATSQYLSHDVRYRSASAPVIAELLTTLVEVQKP